MQDEQSRSRADDILSQIDIMLPSQYFATVGSAGLSGEQRLMLAVLIDAINVLQSWKGTGSPRKRHNFAEAVQWVNTRGTHHPFSFDSVCDALEIDSALVRSRLSGLTVRPANSARRPALGHLRIKELSRRQHMTANKPRRRERIPRVSTGSTDLTVPSARSLAQPEPDQDRTAEASSGLAAFVSLSSGTAIGAGVSW
jgi:hypothetical protein